MLPKFQEVLKYFFLKMTPTQKFINFARKFNFFFDFLRGLFYSRCFPHFAWRRPTLFIKPTQNGRRRGFCRIYFAEIGRIDRSFWESDRPIFSRKFCYDCDRAEVFEIFG